MVKIPIENAAQCCGQICPEPAPAETRVPEGRTSLVLLLLRIQEGKRLLEALKDGLPHRPGPDVREILIRLLYGSRVEEALAAVNARELLPRDVINEQVEYLDSLIGDFQALVAALPVKLADERADRALQLLVNGFRP